MNDDTDLIADLVDHRMINYFLVESNRIEGIVRQVKVSELAATRKFLALERVGVKDVEALVEVYQPGAKLRDCQGMNVYVGTHTAPPGGPQIRLALSDLLAGILNLSPFQAHVNYENLHPFMDGNGRSGRALWLWHMRKQNRPVGLSFLHHWYYQTLEFLQGQK